MTVYLLFEIDGNLMLADSFSTNAEKFYVDKKF
jgi:hypothetical protein